MNRFVQSIANGMVVIADAFGAWVRLHVVDEQPWEWDPALGDGSAARTRRSAVSGPTPTDLVLAGLDSDPLGIRELTAEPVS